MLTGIELGAAIESARRAKKVSKKKLAEDFGVAPPSVQGWVKTGRIDKAKLMQLIDYFSDSVPLEHWGLGGWLSDRDADNPPATTDEDLYPSASVLTIRHLDVSASMGPGKQPPEHFDTVRSITIHLDWLRTQGLTYSSIENLAIITGDGDSMTGTFSNGDSLLVDRGITEIRTDAIYVFTMDGDLFIKRLQRMTGGSLRMISDNPIYPPIIIEGDRLERVHIQARVLSAWNVRKF
ncbi:S24 family peptidase [Pseudomonas chlororaphis]|uniref:S24 family peptidase n=1 Tax=Pseudomonas chlororaphis TaxID=587753 RepID=UPI000F551A9C|nr:prophage MuSo1, transcriptional regulator, Cro/CI family [Pseudomonas chlororaphis subsp. aurantiaca]